MIQTHILFWQLIHVLSLLEKQDAKAHARKNGNRPLIILGFGATQERLQDSRTDSVFRSVQPGQRVHISELQKGFVT